MAAKVSTISNTLEKISVTFTITMLLRVNTTKIGRDMEKEAKGKNCF